MAFNIKQPKLIKFCKFLIWYLLVIFFVENLIVFLHIHGIVEITTLQNAPQGVDPRIGLTANMTPTGNSLQNISSTTHRTEISDQRKDQNKTQMLPGSFSLYKTKVSNSKQKANLTTIATNEKLVVKLARAKTPRPIPTNDPVLERKYFTKQSIKVNKFRHKFVMKPRTICNKDTFMIILVHSFHPYGDKRMAIRETWGRVARGVGWPNKSISDDLRLVFMLGTHKQIGYNDKIRDEMEVYNDIVQGDFIDDYKNMTLKSLLGLKLVKEFCPQAKFTLKSDDDMMINIPYLLEILHSTPYNFTVMGPLNRGSRVYRSGKWKLTKEQYPFYTFPQYEAGSAYVFTADLVQPFFDTAEYVPSFHIDDVYITGVLGRILNVTHAIQPGFAYWTDKPPKSCEILNNVKLTGTKMTPQRLRSLWTQIEKNICIPEKKVSTKAGQRPKPPSSPK